MSVRRPVVLIVFSLLLTASLAQAASNVVISQVYGGGGNSGATVKNDFIELFNRGAEPVSLAGWSVQYASSSGTSWAVTPLTAFVLQPGQYYLVQQAKGTGGTVDLPTPDATGSIAMAAGAGKVALVASTTALSGTCPVAVDFVGFGGANCSETTPTPALSNTTAAIRKSAGCTDTDSNASDFATGAPNPRNSATPANSCGAPPVNDLPPTIVSPANPAASVDQDAAPFQISLTGNDDKAAYNWSASTLTGLTSAVVTSGQGTPNATYTVTLQPGFSGTASFTARLSDGVNPAATAPVTITVAPAPLPPLDHIVISQIYAGGGGTSSVMKNDYVELFNPTTEPVDMAGWSIQYSSAVGTGSWQSQLIGGVMQPGEFFLIRLAGNSVGADLPAANVNGSLTLGANGGKIALSRSLEPLNGCPIGDDDLVDLVGWGNANCREGASNAPISPVDMAIFRNGGGFGDTNQNGYDFQQGAPAPRRTTPIQEIGPAVFSTNPRSNGFDAPRDGSISISFTEPVEVSGAWFSIGCAASGRHDDVVVNGGSSSWLITPNTPFQPGETCTVTIFRNFVSDSDLDDGGAHDDHLRSDYVFTFQVAAAVALPYTPDVHLTFGNPSNAVADVTTPNNFLMVKPEFALSYNRDRGTANWVSWHLSSEWRGGEGRSEDFRPDPAIPADWYRVLHWDYSGTGFSRGHIAPSADRTSDVAANQATFLMTNMMPQTSANNEGPWGYLENSLRTHLGSSEIYVIAGPAGVGGNNGQGIVNVIADGRITVPAYTWKVALLMPKMSGDDIGRVTAATRAIAVIMPNVSKLEGDAAGDWRTYRTTVDAVEQLTGFDFFAELPDYIENAVEAGFDGANPPAVQLSSPNTTVEGSPVSATLTVSDNASGSSTSTWTVMRNGAPYGDGGTGNTVSFTPNDDGTYVITATVTAADGATASATSSISVTNAAPVITSSSATQTPVALGAPASASVAYTDAGTADTHTATFTWSDGTTTVAGCATGVCTASHTYATSGVYATSVVVTDDDGAPASAASGTVVVYDNNGGSVTGGGFITTAAGKATFNLNARYLKGATAPTGNTRLELASSTLTSTSHGWLVINGNTARYQGSGTIDGAGDYAFLVVATDGGASDTIQFRVWDKVTGATIFDSGTAGVSGSINLHK